MSEKDVLLVESTNGICTLTINRPSRRNALTAEVFTRLREAIGMIRDDTGIGVVILRGAGTEAFSSGYEIGHLDESVDYGEKNRMEEISLIVEELPVPTIAMIYGYCIAGGLGLALSCDLRIAGDNARLGTTPAKLGLVYPPKGLLRCINVVGMSATKEMFYTARIIDAARASQIHLVDRVVPVDLLAETTGRLAREIAANAPLSVRGTKAAISKLLAYQEPSPELLRDLARMREQAASSKDFSEGRKAFAEKRKPVFRGE